MKYIDEIAQYMQAIDLLGVGDRTALMRAAGSQMQDSPRARTVCYSVLPYTVPDRQIQRWFAAGCLKCVSDKVGGPPVPLPVILNSMRKQEAWSGYLKDRTVQLLETRWSDQDGFLLTKLTRFVKMLSQKGYRVDCGALLQDLIDWNCSSQIAQERWIRTIYRDKKKEN